MAQAILIFNLPEDNQEFELATKASKMYSTLWELDNWLRGEIKYKDKELDEVRDKLRELMNDNRIDFDMVE
jgi:hypothetical protein